MSLPPSDIIVCGYSRFPKNTSAEQVHSVLALVVRIETSGNTVVSASTTLVTEVAQRFIAELIVGRNILKDHEDVVKAMEASYFGYAQRSIIFAFKNLVSNYISILVAESKQDPSADACHRMMGLNDELSS
jgi:hypothetical protein